MNWTKFTDYSIDSTLYIKTSHEIPRWRFDILINTYNSIGIFVSNSPSFITTFTDYKDGGTMPTSSNLYETDNEHYLTFEITKAIPHQQYSLTFSGEMVNEEGKVIKITEGRFDIKKNNP